MSLNAMALERRIPQDCRYELGYPGAKTVLFCLSSPNMTAHLPTKRCATEHPHLIKECGEWSKCR